MGLPWDILQMNIGQIFHASTLPSSDLSGQTIIITGANTGLGFEAAKHLLAASLHTWWNAANNFPLAISSMFLTSSWRVAT